MIRRIALALVLAFATTACEDRTVADAAVCATDGGPKAFGDPCSSGCECTSGVCFLFGDGTHACTLTCGSNEECPVGTQGPKCNGQGVCKP